MQDLTLEERRVLVQEIFETANVEIVLSFLMSINYAFFNEKDQRKEIE